MLLAAVATASIDSRQADRRYEVRGMVRRVDAPVTLSSFAGKIVVMNFVHTRCALPQFCLRMSDTFSVVQKRFSHVLGRDVQLLTIHARPGARYA